MISRSDDPVGAAESTYVREPGLVPIEGWEVTISETVDGGILFDLDFRPLGKKCCSLRSIKFQRCQRK